MEDPPSPREGFSAFDSFAKASSTKDEKDDHDDIVKRKSILEGLDGFRSPGLSDSESGTSESSSDVRNIDEGDGVEGPRGFFGPCLSSQHSESVETVHSGITEQEAKERIGVPVPAVANTIVQPVRPGVQEQTQQRRTSLGKVVRFQMEDERVIRAGQQSLASGQERHQQEQGHPPKLKRNGTPTAIDYNVKKSNQSTAQIPKNLSFDLNEEDDDLPMDKHSHRKQTRRRATTTYSSLSKSTIKRSNRNDSHLLAKSKSLNSIDYICVDTNDTPNSDFSESTRAKNNLKTMLGDMGIPPSNDMDFHPEWLASCERRQTSQTRQPPPQPTTTRIQKSSNAKKSSAIANKTDITPKTMPKEDHQRSRLGDVSIDTANDTTTGTPSHDQSFRKNAYDLSADTSDVDMGIKTDTKINTDTNTHARKHTNEYEQQQRGQPTHEENSLLDTKQPPILLNNASSTRSKNSVDSVQLPPPSTQTTTSTEEPFNRRKMLQKNSSLSELGQAAAEATKRKGRRKDTKERMHQSLRDFNVDEPKDADCTESYISATREIKDQILGEEPENSFSLLEVDIDLDDPETIQPTKNKSQDKMSKRRHTTGVDHRKTKKVESVLDDTDIPRTIELFDSTVHDLLMSRSESKGRSRSRDRPKRRSSTGGNEVPEDENHERKRSGKANDRLLMHKSLHESEHVQHQQQKEPKQVSMSMHLSMRELGKRRDDTIGDSSRSYGLKDPIGTSLQNQFSLTSSSRHKDNQVAKSGLDESNKSWIPRRANELQRQEKVFARISDHVLSKKTSAYPSSNTNRQRRTGAMDRMKIHQTLGQLESDHADIGKIEMYESAHHQHHGGDAMDKSASDHSRRSSHGRRGSLGLKGEVEQADTTSAIEPDENQRGRRQESLGLKSEYDQKVRTSIRRGSISNKTESHQRQRRQGSVADRSEWKDPESGASNTFDNRKSRRPSATDKDRRGTKATQSLDTETTATTATLTINMDQQDKRSSRNLRRSSQGGEWASSRRESSHDGRRKAETEGKTTKSSSPLRVDTNVGAEGRRRGRSKSHRGRRCTKHRPSAQPTLNADGKKGGGNEVDASTKRRGTHRDTLVDDRKRDGENEMNTSIKRRGTRRDTIGDDRKHVGDYEIDTASKRRGKRRDTVVSNRNRSKIRNIPREMQGGRKSTRDRSHSRNRRERRHHDAEKILSQEEAVEESDNVPMHVFVDDEEKDPLNLMDTSQKSANFANASEHEEASPSASFIFQSKARLAPGEGAGRLHESVDNLPNSKEYPSIEKKPVVRRLKTRARVLHNKAITTDVKTGTGIEDKQLGEKDRRLVVRTSSGISELSYPPSDRKTRREKEARRIGASFGNLGPVCIPETILLVSEAKNTCPCGSTGASIVASPSKNLSFSPTGVIKRWDLRNVFEGSDHVAMQEMYASFGSLEDQSPHRNNRNNERGKAELNRLHQSLGAIDTSYLTVSPRYAALKESLLAYKTVTATGERKEGAISEIRAAADIAITSALSIDMEDDWEICDDNNEGELDVDVDCGDRTDSRSNSGEEDEAVDAGESKPVPRWLLRECTQTVLDSASQVDPKEKRRQRKWVLEPEHIRGSSRRLLHGLTEQKRQQDPKEEFWGVLSKAFVSDTNVGRSSGNPE